MTNEQNFKKGDRVRVAIKDWRMSVDMGNDVGAIMTGDVGVVTGPSYDGDLIEVAFCDGWVRYDFGRDEIELVEHYDRRTAFLTRLQSLMREFNARICDGEGYMVIMELDSESDKSELLNYATSGWRLNEAFTSSPMSRLTKFTNG